jgi:hypothetical protein
MGVFVKIKPSRAKILEMVKQILEFTSHSTKPLRRRIQKKWGILGWRVALHEISNVRHHPTNEGRE